MPSPSLASTQRRPAPAWGRVPVSHWLGGTDGQLPPWRDSCAVPASQPPQPRRHHGVFPSQPQPPGATHHPPIFISAWEVLLHARISQNISWDALSWVMDVTYPRAPVVQAWEEATSRPPPGPAHTFPPWSLCKSCRRDSHCLQDGHSPAGPRKAAGLGPLLLCHRPCVFLCPRHVLGHPFSQPPRCPLMACGQHGALSHRCLLVPGAGVLRREGAGSWLRGLDQGTVSEHSSWHLGCLVSVCRVCTAWRLVTGAQGRGHPSLQPQLPRAPGSSLAGRRGCPLPRLRLCLSGLIKISLAQFVGRHYFRT